MLNRPEITEARLLQIKEIIEKNPDWNRSKISQHICEIWDWSLPNGQLKDMSCRDMLRLLERKGEISLPPPQGSIRIGNRNRATKCLEHCTEPIHSSLADLMPLQVTVVEDAAEIETFKSLIQQYHYLGFDRTVGESMKYIVRCKGGKILACLLFGAAAWSCGDRDAYIGWDAATRKERLHLMANNQRFLVPPWIHVPCLASHSLALVSRRITSDWKDKYGHSILVLETFVDQRFKGICYRASNWVRVGATKGRGRNDRGHERLLPVKDIYLYPLARNACRKLAKTQG